MKLKYQPEDFQVEELPVVEPQEHGPYAYYRLTKNGIGTIEAIETIRRAWNLSGRQISYGGLKDRHAQTIQYLTIASGPNRGFETPQIALEPIGRLRHPYGPAHFRGNRFALVLRDLTPEAARSVLAAIEAMPNDGLPNYFDDQRFGSVGVSNQLIGHAWLLGDHETALKLAIAEPTRSDRAADKGRKRILQETWGDWPEAKARLDRSSERSIVTYLVDHPTDFRGAFARLRRELRTLYFSAFQSHLWNRVLARWIEQSLPADQRVEVSLRMGPHPFPFRADPDLIAELGRLSIPLPSSRNRLPEGELGRAVESVLSEFQVSWTDLRVRHLKDVFFSKGERPALLRLANLVASAGDDTFHRRRQCVHLNFELEKGSYATILVKRITEAGAAAG
jgi:tRNA pseudouridine13 synthase